MDTQIIPPSQIFIFDLKLHNIKVATKLDNNHAIYLMCLLSEINESLTFSGAYRDYPLPEKLKELHKVLGMALTPKAP